MSAGVLFASLLAIAAPPAAPAEPSASEARKDMLTRFGAAIWQARRDRLLTAAKSLEALAKQDPDSTAALKELIPVYTQLGRERDAIRVARTVLEKDPTDADAAHGLARLLRDAGEFAEAASFARTAAEHTDAEERPEKALAVYRDLAAILDRAGEAAASAAAYDRAIKLLTVKRKIVLASGARTPREIDEDVADFHERRGKVLVKAGKPDDAATAFREAHKLYSDPKRANDPGAAARLDWNLSATFAATGDAAEALRHLNAFLKLRPQAIEPYERLVALLNQAGRGGDVVAALRTHAARDGDNLGLRAVLAAELARDADSRRAADADFVSLLQTTNDPKIHRIVLRSHIEAHRPGQILAELDRVYLLLKEPSTKADAKAFAAEKARIIAEILRAEARWSEDVLRAAADDLRTGTTRTHQTWHALGLLAARHHRLDLAAVQYRQALAVAPIEGQWEVYSRLIEVLHRDQKPTALAELCREGLRRGDLVRVYPLFPAFLNYHLAAALAQLGDAEEAVAAADRAISQSADADRLAFRLRKVWVLEILGRWDDAAAACRKLLDEFDAPADRSRIRHSLATSYWGGKKYRESETELRAILDLDPDDAGACNDLGYHLADQGRDLDEAERLVRHAVAIDRIDRRKSGEAEPENAAYLDSLAWVLFRRGKLPEARDLLEKVAAMPDGITDAVVWDHLGDVRFRLGEKEKAKAAWEEAARRYAADIRGKRDGRFDEVKRKLKLTP